jgi:hypothetical protein
MYSYNQALRTFLFVKLTNKLYAAASKIEQAKALTISFTVSNKLQAEFCQ